jgi:hypothetical protein
MVFMMETWLLCITLVLFCPLPTKAVDRPAFKYSCLSAGCVIVTILVVLYRGWNFPWLCTDEMMAGLFTGDITDVRCIAGWHKI